jgi:outer membrane protein OmpA-like peptidoglycan-associated protein
MLANALSLCLASVVVGASALTLQLVQPRGSDAAPDVTSGSASIYFEAAEAVVDDEAVRSIAAIARMAKTSLMPVAILPFSGSPGSLDHRSGLAQMRAKRVREALVRAGIPRTRIIIVSPIFVPTHSERVEVSLVPGVRMVPASSPVASPQQ